VAHASGGGGFEPHSLDDQHHRPTQMPTGEINWGGKEIRASTEDDVPQCITGGDALHETSRVAGRSIEQMDPPVLLEQHAPVRENLRPVGGADVGQLFGSASFRADAVQPRVGTIRERDAIVGTTEVSARTFAIPKSSTFTTLPGVIFTLAGLRSRWSEVQRDRVRWWIRIQTKRA
jgi:hypothetical protein